jgi:hypothetical protein
MTTHATPCLVCRDHTVQILGQLLRPTDGLCRICSELYRRGVILWDCYGDWQLADLIIRPGTSLTKPSRLAEAAQGYADWFERLQRLVASAV